MWQVKKPAKMRRWLVTTTMVAHDVRERAIGAHVPVIREVARYVLDDERDPSVSLMVTYQLSAQEIAFVQAPKARGKKRGKK